MFKSCDVQINNTCLRSVSKLHTQLKPRYKSATSSVKLPPVMHVIRHADLSNLAQMVRSYLMLFNRIRVNVALTHDVEVVVPSGARRTPAWVGPLMRLAWRVALILSRPTVLVAYCWLSVQDQVVITQVSVLLLVSTLTVSHTDSLAGFQPVAADITCVAGRQTSLQTCFAWACMFRLGVVVLTLSVP